MRSSRLAALLASSCLIAGVAHASSLPLTGAGSGTPVVVPAYTPGGILMQTDAGVGNDTNNGTTNSTSFTLIATVKGQQGVLSGGVPTPTTLTNFQGPPLWQARKTENCEIPATPPPTAKGICGSFDNSAFLGQISFNNNLGSAKATDQILLTGDGVQNHVNVPSVWNTYIFTCDTAAQKCGVVVNGVNQGSNWGLANAIPLNMLADFNTGGWHLLNAANTTFGKGYGEVSNFMWTMGHPYACTALNTPATMDGISVSCPSAGVVPQEIINKIGTVPADTSKGTAFLLNDPGATCNLFGYTMDFCLLPTAAAPTTTFLTQHGNATSGAMSVVAVTTHGTIFGSRFGPAGIPDHQATLRWFTYQRFNPTVGAATVAASPDNNPIVAGDFVALLYQGATNNPATTPVSGTCPSDGNTWTQVFMRDNASNSGGNSYMACYGFPTTNLTGPFTGTFSANLARNSSYVVLDYKNVASVDVACSLYNTPTPAPHKTCSATTASANETLISAWFNNEANDSSAPWNFPVAVGGVARTPDNGDAQIMVGDEYAVASGANVQRSATSFAGATGDSSYGLSISLVPN